MTDIQIGSDVVGPGGKPARFFGFDRKTGEAVLGLMEEGEVTKEVRMKREEFEALNSQK